MQEKIESSKIEVIKEVVRIFLDVEIFEEIQVRRGNGRHISFSKVKVSINKSSNGRDVNVFILFSTTFYMVPVPNMDTLRKMYFFRPRVHVIGLQKCMTTISGLLTIAIKN